MSGVVLHLGPEGSVGFAGLCGGRRRLLLNPHGLVLPLESRSRELLVLLEVRPLEIADLSEQSSCFCLFSHLTPIAI